MSHFAADNTPSNKAGVTLMNNQVGYVVANVVPREGSSYFISPHYLLDSAEAWGPQTLLLAVDRAVDRSHMAMGELQKATLSHVFAMRAVLRPDQAEIFDKAVAEALLPTAKD